MVQEEDQRELLVNPVALWASWLTILAMAALYWRFHGFTVPDWDGYGDLWDNDGGWLLRQGRDPLFVWGMHQAKAVFGPDGYDEFRLTLFGVFTVFAARAAYVIREGRVSVLIVVPIVIAALLLKSLAQIREGVALLLVAWPLVKVFARTRNAWVSTGLAVTVAGFVHPSAWLFAGVWLAAVALYVSPSWTLSGSWPRFILLLTAVALGVMIQRAVVANADVLEFALRDLGADTSAEAVGGDAKYAYWLGMAAVTLTIRAQLFRAAWGSRKFGYAYATVLGSFVLPVLCTVCLLLVFDKFYLPIVTSAFVRLLLTSLTVGLLIIGCRGKANWLTLAIALALIADQARLLFIS